MKFKMLMLIIVAGCSASPGENSSQSPIVGFPPNSPEARSFINKVNSAGLYQIHQSQASDTNFVINPDGSFYVGVEHNVFTMYSVLRPDTNAVYSRPSGSYLHYYGVILTADNKLMEAEYKTNPSAQNTSTLDQLYARYRTVTNIYFSGTNSELALPKSNP